MAEVGVRELKARLSEYLDRAARGEVIRFTHRGRPKPLAWVTGARSLDALHFGAAKVVGGGALPIATFDLRQEQAARSLGGVVLGG